MYSILNLKVCEIQRLRDKEIVYGRKGRKGNSMQTNVTLSKAFKEAVMAAYSKEISWVPDVD